MLSKLFSKTKKPQTYEIKGVGAFVYYKDNEDEYWKIESPVLSLPTGFIFGAIAGTANEPNADALQQFLSLAENPHLIESLIGSDFERIASKYFEQLSIDKVKSEFFIQSVSVSSSRNFEFGLHAKSKDIFIESFVRDGIVTDVYLDEGCCSA